MNNTGSHAQHDYLCESVSHPSFSLSEVRKRDDRRSMSTDSALDLNLPPPPPVLGEVYVTGERGVSIHDSGPTALCLRPGGYFISIIIIPTVFTSRVLSRVKNNFNGRGMYVRVIANITVC